MAKIKLIGIGGTDGSGKDSLGEMLAERHGWMYVSVTDILRDEARRRGIPLRRDTLREISAEWRREFGLGVLVDKALVIYKKSSGKHNGLAMASLRNSGEVDRLHELGGTMVWADADPQVRYQRVSGRNRGTEDHITYEEFLAEEKAQSHHGGDKHALSLNDVKSKADIFIENNGNDIEKFKTEAEKVLKKYL